MRIPAAILFASALLVPLAVRADPAALAEVCGQLIGAQVGACHAAARGRFVDREAVGACGQLIGGQVVSCVGAIAGKDYDPGEVRNCGQLIGGQVITCLGQTGRPHIEPPPHQLTYPLPAPDDPPRRRPMTVAEIRTEVAAALESLRASDQLGTERRLRRLLRDLR